VLSTTLGLLVALIACAAPAHAAEPSAAPFEPSLALASAEDAASQDPAPAEPPAPAEKGWEFATIGYAWLAGAWGETDVIVPVAPVDVDLPFGKVLDSFKFAFMGAAELKRDRLVILGDLTFIHLDADEGIGIRDPDFLEAELDTRTSEVTLIGGYRIVDEPSVNLDLLAGGRLNWLKLSLQLSGPNREADGEIKKTWFDPLVGGRVAVPVAEKWSLGLYGDVGGFGVGSSITWQLWPTVSYQLSRRMTLGAGWRYYKVKYRDGDFLYNVHQSGPLITFVTRM
jgi:hypothetical protein